VSIVVAVRLLKLRRLLPSWQDILREFRNGWHITTSTLAVSSYIYINILTLRFFTSDTAVGYYSVAEKIINAARQVLTVYFQAIYPQVCQLVMKTRREIFTFFKRYYLPFLTLVLGGCFILFLFPEPIVGFFLRQHRELSAEYLRIMSFVPFIICLNIPAYQVLIAHDEKAVLFVVFGSGTIINLILNLLIVRVWGAVGTSFVILATECLVTSGLVGAMAINPKVGLLHYLRSRVRT
jgi:PST family polysaccharide transporter